MLRRSARFSYYVLRNIYAVFIILESSGLIVVASDELPVRLGVFDKTFSTRRSNPVFFCFFLGGGGGGARHFPYTGSRHWVSSLTQERK